MTLNLQNVGRCIGNQWIVRHLSFQIDNDECLALVGPSGCGKSTLLNIFSGKFPPETVAQQRRWRNVPSD